MINQFVPKIINEIAKINTENELMNLKSKYLGKKGEFTIFTNSLKDLSIEFLSFFKALICKSITSFPISFISFFIFNVTKYHLWIKQDLDQL